jgi:AcrR family transcriptional regulator
MAPRPQHSQDLPTRRTQAERTGESSRRLIEAAVKLICEQGWERTTTAEIGLRAGYSRSIVNFHYGSKDALLEAILRKNYEVGFLEPAVDSTASGLEQVLARLDRLDQLVTADPPFLRAMFVLNFEAVGPATSLRPRTIQWLERLEQRLTDSVLAGQQDGSIRNDLDPREEVSGFLATGLGYTYRWALTPESVDLRTEITHWRNQVVRQLAAK